MTSASCRVATVADVSVARRLFLIWQNPGSRQFVRVGTLFELVDGRYAFEYTASARATDDFYPLTQFPDMERTYVSTGLPAFFVNRLMSRKRESFTSYLHALGIDSDAVDTPMELLARTGGPRATDTFHLVDDLMADADGVVVSRFLASGVRYLDADGTHLARVRDGDRLRLRVVRYVARKPTPANSASKIGSSRRSVLRFDSNSCTEAMNSASLMITP